MATSAKRLLTADEFLAIEWEDSDIKAELDNGVIRVIRMMAGGSLAHSRVQGNVFAALFTRLRGSGCRPHGPDMGIRTHDLSIRYPDVSVICGPATPDDGMIKERSDPKLVVEVLSPTTRRSDEQSKLPEYQAMPALEAILYIDPDAETLRLLTRTDARGWMDENIDKQADIAIPSLGLTLPRSEIFLND